MIPFPDMPDLTPKSSKRSWVAVFAVVCLLSWAVRELSALLVSAPGTEAATRDWIVTDPDGLYHARRVLRAIEEDSPESWLPIAGTDPHLNYPGGAAIPWPPYYDLFLYGVIAPFAPRGDEPEQAAARRLYVETRTATWPLIFGILTTLLVAASGGLLAGRAGALAAGLYHALAPAATIYAKRGVADHHAFVALLLALLLALFTGTLHSPRDDASRRRSLLFGLACGTVTGLLLGSWVASLVYVALVDVVLGLLILLDFKGRDRALSTFGLSYHVTAFVVLLPAVLESPWVTQQPWSVVNLSQFHLVYLALGALVFVPLPFLAGRPLRRVYPLLFAAFLAASTAALAASNSPAWQGLREAFAWADRSDPFMSSIQESRPLWEAVRSGESGGFARAQRFLGLGIALLPLAWIAALLCAVRRRSLALLPWILFAPVLLIQALQQTRFTDVLTIPLAVLIGWSLAQLSSRVFRSEGRKRSALQLLAVVLCTGLLHAKSVSELAHRIQQKGLQTQFVRMPRQRAARASLDWLRARSSDSSLFGERPGSVLANWSRGHLIEWSAGLPTVATNFGSYLGEASWTDPGKIFLESSPPIAERRLIEREVRWIFVSSEFPNALPTLARSAYPGESERWIARTPEGAASLQPAFFETLGARLMFFGGSPLEGDLEPIDFLRLVRVAPERDPRPKLARWAPKSSMNWLWEHVPGARLVFTGAPPGQSVVVQLRLRCESTAERFAWTASAIADDAGRAEVRVPYSTEGGDSEISVDEATATIETRRIELTLPEEAVLGGLELRP